MGIVRTLLGNALVGVAAAASASPFFHLRFNLDAAIHFFRIFAVDLLS